MSPLRRNIGLIVIAIALLSLDSAAAAEPQQITSRITRQPVHSHALAAVGYSKRLHALEVEFVNGAVYRYSNVPPEIYRAFITAKSKGSYYNDHIRDVYLYERL